MTQLLSHTPNLHLQLLRSTLPPLDSGQLQSVVSAVKELISRDKDRSEVPKLQQALAAQVLRAGPSAITVQVVSLAVIALICFARCPLSWDVGARDGVMDFGSTHR